MRTSQLLKTADGVSRQLSLLLWWVLTLVAASANATTGLGLNLLQNGSFESPTVRSNWMEEIQPDGWDAPQSIYVANGMINLSPPWSGFPYPVAQDSVQYVLLGGNGQDRLSQSFSVTNSERYLLTWFETSVIPAGSSGTAAVYSVFIETAPEQILILKTNFDAAHREWKGRSIPVSLEAGQYRLSFARVPLPNSFSTIIDNVTLVEQPEDLLGQVEVSAVDFSWPGRTNHQYQVQFRTSLQDANWQNLGIPVTGNGSNMITDRILGTERRFYRVIRVP